MHNNWLVLLPPCIVLLSAFITQRLNISLLIGILAGSLIATDFSLVNGLTLSMQRLFSIVSDPENISLYAFLFIISIIIVLLNRTGGAFAFATALTNKIRSKRMAETSSLLLSLTLFIDDYLNGLTVGYVMRPITDRFNIPRAKLAFLVQAMTAPLVILAPISSWGGAITGALEQAGIGALGTHNVKILGDPFFIYIEAIPYIFYSFIIIGATWFIVQSRISYGPMREHEKLADTTGNLFGGKKPLLDSFANNDHAQGSLADLLLPLITLIGGVVIGSLYAGDYYLFGGKHSFIDAFKYNDKILFILVMSSIITLIVSYLFAYIRNKIASQDTLKMIKEGYDLIYSAIFMVILAATLGTILKADLLTGQYLANILHGSLSAMFLPLIFFIISTIAAAITGSSWGTIMLLSPIAVPMLITLAQVPIPTTPDSLPYLLPVLGAIFSGSVCGNHISPIADVTIMTATSSGSYPLDHAHTQFLYIVPAIISCAISYLLSGFLVSYPLAIRLLIPLIVGLLLCCVMLYSMHVIYKRRNT